MTSSSSSTVAKSITLKSQSGMQLYKYQLNPVNGWLHAMTVLKLYVWKYRLYSDSNDRVTLHHATKNRKIVKQSITHISPYRYNTQTTPTLP